MVKQPRVFADLAGLLHRPWEAYNCLSLAHRRGAGGKLLFGSDFPFCTAAESIERLYRLNEVTAGTSLPPVPREVLRQIVEREALKELNIE